MEGTMTRGRLRVEHGRKRIRTYLGGELAADTTNPLLVWEVPYYPAYYIPVGDILADLVPTGNTDHSPSRGDADIFDLRTPAATAPSAARRYTSSPIEELRQAVRLDWEPMDEWLEEDEPVYTYPATLTPGLTSWPAPGMSGLTSTASPSPTPASRGSCSKPASRRASTSRSPTSG